jgi:hypothetical protein
MIGYIKQKQSKSHGLTQLDGYQLSHAWMAKGLATLARCLLGQRTALLCLELLDHRGCVAQCC